MLPVRWHGHPSLCDTLCITSPASNGTRTRTSRTKSCIARGNQMATKSSASSRLGKQIRVTAESIRNKPLTDRQKAALDGVARRQKRADVSRLDYSDIPKLTDKQLTQFRRPPKKLVAVRLDADVFEWLQQYGAGYSTRINNVLRVVMSKGR